MLLGTRVRRIPLKPAWRIPNKESGGPRNMKSTGVAYLLWLLTFVGFAGIHRFYAGKWVTGLLWLFTWGLFGIGTLLDVFLIPGMIERSNFGHRLSLAGV